MDEAAPIERRFEAMRAFYEAGVRTTCFISPIFPGITDVPAIIRRAKGQCNLIWLENLNLRGGCKKNILGYIAARFPSLMPIYEAIYVRGDRGYWAALDGEIRTFAAAEGLPYVRDDDSIRRPFAAPPLVVNYFFHEEIIPSAKRAKARNGQK